MLTLCSDKPTVHCTVGVLRVLRVPNLTKLNKILRKKSFKTFFLQTNVFNSQKAVPRENIPEVTVTHRNFSLVLAHLEDKLFQSLNNAFTNGHTG